MNSEEVWSNPILANWIWYWNMLIRHLYQKSASGVEKICLEFGEFLLDFFGFDVIIINTRPVGQAVKTPPFHGGNRGSIPLRVTKTKRQFTRVDWRFVLVLFSFHSSLFTLHWGLTNSISLFSRFSCSCKQQVRIYLMLYSLFFVQANLKREKSAHSVVRPFSLCIYFILNSQANF